MNTQRRFLFDDKERTDSSLSVVVPEVVEPDYSMYTWPCAPVLAQYIWYNRQKVRGQTTLEIGAGTALPSIVAGHCGADVHISDRPEKVRGKTTLEIGAGTALPSIVAGHCGADVHISDRPDLPSIVAGHCGADVHISDRPDLLSYPQKITNTFQLNGLSPPIIHSIPWGVFNSDVLNLPKVDIVLASDCFYDTKDFEDIIVTVAYIFDKNPDCEFWCTYQERSSLRSIAYLLDKWEIQCRTIKLDKFHADGPSVAQSDLPGNHTIHMYVMKQRNS